MFRRKLLLDLSQLMFKSRNVSGTRPVLTNGSDQTFSCFSTDLKINHFIKISFILDSRKPRAQVLVLKDDQDSCLFMVLR